MWSCSLREQTTRHILHFFSNVLKRKKLKTMEKTCLHCEKPFEGGGATLFCTDKCRHEAYTEVSQRSIVDFLADESVHYYSQKQSDFWYCSPFRAESKASFKVNLKRNVWYDFGLGEGGNIFQLVQKLFNCNKSEAFQMLIERDLKLVTNFKPAKETPIIQINKVKDIENKALIEYLKTRLIPLNLARLYLKEAYFVFNHHNVQDRTQFFGLAFKNDKKGYELRPALKNFKFASSPKYLTTIKRNGNNTAVNVFEGFFDFLSALVYFKTDVPVNDTIILNSLSFVDESIKQIKLADYKIVNLFLDNDEAGYKAVIKYQQTGLKILIRSKQYYSDFKDFNEFLTRPK